MKEKDSKKEEKGYPGIFKRPGTDNWCFRYQVNKSRKTVSLGTKDYDEAVKIVREKYKPLIETTSEEVLAAHVANARKMHIQSKKLYLANAWDVYSTSPERANPATVSEQQSYKSSFDDFVKFLDNPRITVAEITHVHAEKYAEDMKKTSTMPLIRTIAI
ncbi:MAG: hypothetical protein MJ202_02460 [Lentisphaeria bacterium]|nr:hypothetical protein [Lentisphaeria bacterium]